MVIQGPANKIDKKTCFVISPIGDDDSPERKRSDRVFEHVIEPTVKKLGYYALPARKIAGSGLITSDIINHVLFDPLVIADLSGANANVYYELALRHAVRKPCILILAKNERPKFDLHSMRMIFFDIDDVRSIREAKNEIATYIRRMDDRFPLETPISAAGIPAWTPSHESNKSSTTGVRAYLTEKQTDDMLENYLLALESAGATPLEVRYLIKELKENPRVFLLNERDDDLETAILLVENVIAGGQITGTSSLQHHDADEHKLYRRAVNEALAKNVKYTKIICSSSDLSPERHEKWMGEFADKASLIREGKIKPGMFRLLHCPFPMSVDVLISRDKDGECQEMVAGFAGGEKHGGFRTKDKEMVAKWFEIYVEEKVMAPAEEHTTAVLEGKVECPCLDFLGLLEDASQAVATPKPLPATMQVRSRNRSASRKRN